MENIVTSIVINEEIWIHQEENNVAYKSRSRYTYQK